VNIMAESKNTGPVSPSSRPVPRPRAQSACQTPPALPAKLSVHSDKDLETRLGILYQTSFPESPLSPLPSPPDEPGKHKAPILPRKSDGLAERVTIKKNDNEQPNEPLYVNVSSQDLHERHKAPKPFPRSSESNEDVPAAVAKNDDDVQSDAAEIVRRDDVSAPSVDSISEEIEPSTVSTSESVFDDQTEELQIRPKPHHLPAPDETPGTKSGRTSTVHQIANTRVSQFVSAVEKAAKSEKPAPTQKPGRLVVSTVLAEKIASGLNRQQTLKSLQQTEEISEVGIDTTGGETYTAAGKPPLASPVFRKRARSHNTLDGSEETKSMLYVKVSSANF